MIIRTGKLSETWITDFRIECEMCSFPFQINFDFSKRGPNEMEILFNKIRIPSPHVLTNNSNLSNDSLINYIIRKALLCTVKDE